MKMRFSNYEDAYRNKDTSKYDDDKVENVFIIYFPDLNANSFEKPLRVFFYHEHSLHL